MKCGIYTVHWEIFEVQNFEGLVILKFFANKFSKMVIKARSGHVHAFKILRFRKIHKNSSSKCESECFLTYVALDNVT